MENMQTLVENIEDWSVDKGLNNSDPNKQMLKVVEEIGELSQGLVKDDRDQVIDSIGDAVVTLVILSQQLGLTLEQCTAYAHNEIKDRKGEMRNGSFVKEADL
ncbi:MazG-like family protein [Staphylococcus cohnii]|uniref:MazG-like family protein n=1 Tax=Staphylococcus cohnii TaxID=29382 RepID=UPI0020163FAA|nr:MazG-like family protein [Staphylococcus cohnii]